MNLKERSQTIDALRYTVQDLDKCIDVIRRKLRKGEYVKGTNYLAKVRAAYELREAAIEMGCNGPLIDLIEPMPFHTGFVGRSAEEVKAIEWIGAGDFFGGRTVVERRIAA